MITYENLLKGKTVYMSFAINPAPAFLLSSLEKQGYKRKKTSNSWMHRRQNYNIINEESLSNENIIFLVIYSFSRREDLYVITTYGIDKKEKIFFTASISEDDNSYFRVKDYLRFKIYGND